MTQDIKSFKVSIQKVNAENIKEYLVETVKKADIGKIIKGAKYLMLKPKQLPKKENKIPWKTVLQDTKKEFRIIWEIFASTPMHTTLIWTIILVLIFGFWDTFASSFLLEFLDKIKP